MAVARDGLFCVHLKAKAVSISLCKDAKAQLSPEIRVAVNIKSLDGYGECSGAVALFWMLSESETPFAHCFHLYFPLHVQNMGGCSFAWPCCSWQPWLCIVSGSSSILCVHCFVWGIWLPSLWLQAWAVGWLQAGQELASRLTGTLCDKLFCCVIFSASAGW